MVNRIFIILSLLLLVSAQLCFAADFGLKTDADNLQPYIPHEKQMEMVRKKLQERAKETGKKPNIVILMVDDMGWGDPGVYGGGAAIGAPTPVIDRLAFEGLKLTSAYSQPTCTPTRASLLTGRLPIRHGLYRPPIYGEKGGISDEITLAKLLNDKGYSTAVSGKWHLGNSPDQQPQNKGFDESYCMYEGSPKFYLSTDYKVKLPELYYDQTLKAYFEKAKAGNKGVMAAKKGEKPNLAIEITWDNVSDLDQKFADFSIDFIQRKAKADKPFFLYHCFTKVHEPSLPSTGFEGKSPAKQVFQDSLMEVDAIVGKIITELKVNNLDKNTMVFLLSDNGPEEDQFPDMGHTPFRGAKGSTWDGGMRVPAIVWWPGMISPMRTSDGLFDFVDIFNTCLSVAGAKDKLPTDRYIDGVDQTSFLLSDDGESNRSAVYLYMLDKLAAVRWKEWKRHLLIGEIGDGSYEGSIGFKNNARLVRTPGLNLMNVYIDNKERKSIGQEKAWTTPIFGQLIKMHQETFVKYPAKAAIVTME